jgi:hypothetical protein
VLTDVAPPSSPDPRPSNDDDNNDDDPGAGTDPSPTPWAFLRLALAALLVAAGAEGMTRLLEPSLEPVGDWPDSSYTAQHDQLAGLDGEVDYLVVGSSSAGAAVRPRSLAELWPDIGNGYTYWLAGPPFRSLEAVVSGVLLDQLAPETVVVGLTMREFNSLAEHEDHYAALLDASAYRKATGRRSWIDRADDLLQDHLALARHRAVLREPVHLVDDLTEPALVPTDIGTDGHLIGADDHELADEPPEHLRQEAAALADYLVSDADLDSLDRLLTDLNQRSIDAVVVNLPVSDDFIGLAPDGHRDYEAYVTAVEEVAKANGAEWHDLMDRSWSDNYFRDVNHLNGRGVARIGPLLADILSSP